MNARSPVRIVYTRIARWCCGLGFGVALIIGVPCGQAQAARTFTFRNECAFPVWPAALSNPGSSLPNAGGWMLAAGMSSAVSVEDGWAGRFWGRTGCAFNSAGQGSCATGDCGAKLQCGGAGGVPPATLFEITTNAAGGLDYYDVSLVDGYNIQMHVQPVPGNADPNAYSCGSPRCTSDLNASCPADLQVKSATGTVIACLSACEKYNTDQYCCRGAYGTPATCPPTAYSQIFKSACPTAYSYAYDDATSTFTCAQVSYTITFCPGGSPPPPASPTASPTRSPAGGITPTPTPIPTSTSGPGSGFAAGVESAGSTGARPWFKPNGWQAAYVILHYVRRGLPQQNVAMNYSGSSARWESLVTGMAAGQVLQYQFTYNKGGLQYDTAWYSWTVTGASSTATATVPPPTRTPTSAGVVPTPTSSPLPTAGRGLTIGFDDLGGGKLQAWFKPADWSASYVILHYLRPGQSQQNVKMTYNTSRSRWEYNISGVAAGQVLAYQYTYNKGGVQYDTAWMRVSLNAVAASAH